MYSQIEPEPLLKVAKSPCLFRRFSHVSYFVNIFLPKSCISLKQAAIKEIANMSVQTL